MENNVKKAEKVEKTNVLIYYKCDHQFLAFFVLQCFNPQLHSSTQIQMTHCFFSLVSLFVFHYLFILIEKSNKQKLCMITLSTSFILIRFDVHRSSVFQQNILLLAIKNSFLFSFGILFAAFRLSFDYYDFSIFSILFLLRFNWATFFSTLHLQLI